MKTKVLPLVLLLAAVVALPQLARAQGKVSFQNDVTRLVYYDPSMGGAVGGTPVSPGNMPSGTTLIADLYMGTSSEALYYYASNLFSPTVAGKLNVANVIATTNAWSGAPALPGGSSVFVKIVVRDIHYPPPPMWTPSTFPTSPWFGTSQMFNFTLGASITYPTLYGAAGNWPAGTYPMESYGTNYKGAIAVYADFANFPSIAQGPASTNVAVGGDATFSVSMSGAPPFSYQWRKNSQPVSDATNSVLTLSSVTTNDAGAYSVVVSNSYGYNISTPATLTVYAPVSITSQPSSTAVPGGGTATFTLSASGVPAPACQWYFQNGPLANATNSSLVVSQVTQLKLGSYYARAYNAYSSATSEVVTLSMSPTALSPFSGAVLVWGKPGSLTVSATGSGTLGYQWFLNGEAIDGATSSTLDFSSVQLTNGGVYSVVVSSEYGSFTNSAQVVVNPANTSIGLYAGITIEGVVGYSYGIEYTTNLSDVSAWTPYTNVVLTQPTQTWVDSVEVHSGPARSYRVTAQ